MMIHLPGLLSLSALLALAPMPANAAVSASTASDVCDAADDPCIVTAEVHVQPGSELDFGQRTLRIEDGGVLDFGDQPASVRCGRLEVDVDAGTIAIRATGLDTLGALGRERRIEAVRQCSGAPRDCFSESDCDLGTCGVRRCTLEPSATCVVDGSCNFGSCNDNRCQLRYDRFCDSDADCVAGPCGNELTCRDSPTSDLFDPAEGPVVCATNADCGLGDCTIGDGGIDLGGDVALDLANPSVALVRAASDIAVRGPVDVSGEWGELNLVSGLGNVTVESPIASDGERGVFLGIFAGSDTVIDAPIAASGEEYGGQIGLNAGRDLLIRDDLVVDTTSGRDLAGEIYLRAKRDIRIDGGSADDPVEIHSGFAKPPVPGERDGDGGWVSMQAGHDIFIDEHTRVGIDGDQATITAQSERNFNLAGEFSARISGPGAYETDVTIFSGHDLVLAGSSTIEIVGEDGARPGRVLLEAGRDAEMAGVVRLHEAEPTPDTGTRADVTLLACMVRVTGTAEITNSVEDSANVVRARGGIVFEDGAAWHCENGPNEVTVRDIDNPLHVAGDLEPPVTLEVDGTLPPCPNCIDPESGDRAFCDDGVGCTADICEDGACLAIPDDAACDDPFFCNGSAICDLDAGCLSGVPIDCSHLNDGCYVGQCDENEDTCTSVLADGIDCDDGDECTGEDSCLAGVCKGRRDVACGDCGSNSIEWGEDCDDGDESFEFGEACSAECQRIPCGHPTASSGVFPTARDALFVLRCSVGLAACVPAVCDADGSGDVEASDALLVLRTAVGIATILECPAAG